MSRRGDNIPPISDYAHWNEDAYYMWYSENKYDMEHWDEEIEDDYDDYHTAEWDPDPDVYEEFDSEKAARSFYEMMAPKCESLSLGNPRDYQRTPTWTVEGFTTEYYEAERKRMLEWRRKRREAEYHEEQARKIRSSMRGN